MEEREREAKLYPTLKSLAIELQWNLEVEVVVCECKIMIAFVSSCRCARVGW